MVFAGFLRRGQELIEGDEHHDSGDDGEADAECHRPDKRHQQREADESAEGLGQPR